MRTRERTRVKPRTRTRTRTRSRAKPKKKVMRRKATPMEYRYVCDCGYSDLEYKFIVNKKKGWVRCPECRKNDQMSLVGKPITPAMRALKK